MCEKRHFGKNWAVKVKTWLLPKTSVQGLTVKIGSFGNTGAFRGNK